ncbi:beta-lactamase [Sphingomonas metalli]|uniref:beta-lactamase n=2 Tax=Sphingomonas metalli TaxID=1779358 RepID=A0A916T144_9SPHN|nr:beta-lactamase [Sphingomonas metalli]
MNRRYFLCGAGLGLIGARAAATPSYDREAVAALRGVESAVGGRLGVLIRDTATGRSIGWRPRERFCHCSTFKLSLAAMALRESDARRLDLAERLAIAPADILEPSPVVASHMAAGRMSILALARASQVASDNAAANILMRRLGGPAALTRFWRGIGDGTSRIDGYEPDINVIPPGTGENSTTPEAMARSLERMVLGDVLAPSSRKLLRDWMAETVSGARRLRAALPPGWSGLDKTGTGMRPGVGNKTNDLAVLLPPDGRGPLVIAAYLETPFAAQVRPRDEAALKAVGDIALTWSRRRKLSPSALGLTR